MKNEIIKGCLIKVKSNYIINALADELTTTKIKTDELFIWLGEDRILLRGNITRIYSILTQKFQEDKISRERIYHIDDPLVWLSYVKVSKLISLCCEKVNCGC